MKKILTLFIIAFFAITVKGEISLFSFGADGAIMGINTKLVKPFEWEADLPLIDTDNFSIKANDGTAYELKLKKIPQSDSEGMFNQAQILSSGKILLTFRNNEEWERTLYDNRKKNIQVSLSSSSFALCFFGHCYDVTPPLLTIVVVNKDHATMVFNQGCFILSYVNDSSEFSIVYTDQFQDTNEDGSLSPATSKVKQWKIWKDGDILKYTQTN